MLAELEAALEALKPRLGELRSGPVMLGGGITNRNFRATLGDHDVVIRLPGKDTELLGIDRDAERVATAAAATLRLGPEVIAYLRDPPCLVTAFISARPLPAEELRGPLLEEVALALRALHDALPLQARFDAFDVVATYRTTAERYGARLPPGLDELSAGVSVIAAVLRGPEHEPVPCHNDLLTANFLHDGRRVRVVDWEYAGMGDRYFDLGNLSVNNGFSEADDEALLAIYWQEPCTPRRFATVRLMRIVSDFREGMWGVVQSAISALDFDFDGYADEHLTRVAAGLADPRFETWLKEARGDRP